jgi:hypothetical protein
MTRYQAAMSALFAKLERARAPSGDGGTHDVRERASASSPALHVVDSSARRIQKLTLPPAWRRPDRSLDNPSRLVRLWRAVRGGDHHGTNPQE